MKIILFRGAWINSKKSDKFERTNGFLWLKTSHTVQQLYVPEDDALRVKELVVSHNSHVVAYPGVRRAQLRAVQ